VGVEDGLVRLADQADADSARSDSQTFYNVGCAWVTDGEREGHGFSSAFAYPPGCLEPAIRDQAPIGNLFDRLWQSHRQGRGEPAKVAASGRQGGNIGLLTQNRLDRSAYGAQAIICALVRFLHTDLYD
jgi:non-canonical (house-cleaning) NTP pyrophosphatase